MRVSAKTIQILLTIIATILAIAALKATSAITIPLAFAFFIAVLVHPLQRWLNRHLPHFEEAIEIAATQTKSAYAD